MHRGFLAAVLMLPGAALLAHAQQPVQSRLILPSDMGRTGVFRIRAGESELQVQAHLLNSAGGTVRPSGCAVTWTTGDPSILSIVRSSNPDAWVRPAREGITQLTAAFSCAPALTTSIPVIVGSAGIANPIAPTAQGAAFYPATLKLTPPGWAYVSGGKLFIRPIDTGVQLIAAVRSPSDALITPAEFPMKWSVSNPGVLAIDTAYDHTVFVSPAGTGTTTVTFTVEGISQSFDVTVQDARPATSDDHATLAARTMKIAASSVAGGGTTALPITVRPAPVPVTGATTALPITVQPAPTSIATAPAQTTPITATAQTSSGGAVATATRTPTALQPAPPGPAPTEIVVHNLNPTGATISWRTVAGASHYTVVREGPGGDEIIGDGDSDTTYALITHTPGTTARYAVLSNFGVGRTAAYSPGRSSSFDVTTTLAANPAAVTAVAAPGLVELSWNAVPHAYGYGLWRTDGVTSVRLYDYVPAQADSLLRKPYFYDTEAPSTSPSGYRVLTYYRDATGKLYSADPATQPRALATAKPPTAPVNDRFLSELKIVSLGVSNDSRVLVTAGAPSGLFREPDTTAVAFDQKPPTAIGDLSPPWFGLAGTMNWHRPGYSGAITEYGIGDSIYLNCRNPVFVTRFVRAFFVFKNNPSASRLMSKPRSVTYPNCASEWGHPPVPERE